MENATKKNTSLTVVPNDEKITLTNYELQKLMDAAYKEGVSDTYIFLGLNEEDFEDTPGPSAWCA